MRKLQRKQGKKLILLIVNSSSIYAICLLSAYLRPLLPATITLAIPSLKSPHILHLSLPPCCHPLQLSSGLSILNLDFFHLSHGSLPPFLPLSLLHFTWQPESPFQVHIWSFNPTFKMSFRGSPLTRYSSNSAVWYSRPSLIWFGPASPSHILSFQAYYILFAIFHSSKHAFLLSCLYPSHSSPCLLYFQNILQGPAQILPLLWTLSKHWSEFTPSSFKPQ